MKFTSISGAGVGFFVLQVTATREKIRISELPNAYIVGSRIIARVIGTL